MKAKKKASKAQLSALVRAQAAWRARSRADRLWNALEAVRSLPRASRTAVLERLQSHSGKVAKALTALL